MGNRMKTGKRRAIVDLLVERDGDGCSWPGCDSEYKGYQLTVDHVHPGLPLPDLEDLSNLRLLCRTCNGRLGARRQLAGLTPYRENGGGGVPPFLYLGISAGERERIGIDPNKLASDAGYERFEARAIKFLAAHRGRASYEDVKVNATYKIVKEPTSSRYMKFAVSESGPLKVCRDNDTMVEIRPEAERWVPDDE